MTTKQLKVCLEFWKTLLNLENWNITVQRGSQQVLQGNLGVNIFSPEEEISEIYIARGEGEQTLVHELLHLVFDGHKTPGEQPYSTMHERALNKTAKALTILREQIDFQE